MTSGPKVAEVLAKAADAGERTLHFAALLARDSGLGDRLVVVGGSAIEVYTKGAYVSGDLDLVGERPRLEKVLVGWGFAKTGRLWFHPAWKLCVDLVRSEGYSGSFALTRVFDSPYGRVRVAAVEDVFLGRLASAKHWRIPQDLDQAVLLMAEHEGSMDWEYVERRACQEMVEDMLQEVRRRLAEAHGSAGT